MTTGLFFSLIGIAIVDSLNPSLFIAQLYLFTTPKPIPRILTYIAGILTVNYLGGLLILSGLRTLIGAALVALSSGVLFGLQLALGLAILGFGLWYKAATSEVGEAKKPRSLSLARTFLFGMAVMVNELTTALPYFVALERLSQEQLPLAGNLVSLLLYNFIFALPLLAFVGLFLWLRSRFTVTIERINGWVMLWMPRIIKYGAILLGATLAFNALIFFLTDSPLFV